EAADAERTRDDPPASRVGLLIVGPRDTVTRAPRRHKAGRGAPRATLRPPRCVGSLGITSRGRRADGSQARGAREGPARVHQEPPLERGAAQQHALLHAAPIHQAELHHAGLSPEREGGPHEDALLFLSARTPYPAPARDPRLD